MGMTATNESRSGEKRSRVAVVLRYVIGLRLHEYTDRSAAYVWFRAQLFLLGFALR